MNPIGLLGQNRPSGRIRGCFVYLLLCSEGDAIFAKVGLADDPVKRVAELLTGCPLDPGVIAAAELPSRQIAQAAEGALQNALRLWHARGEWFRLAWRDKGAFNAVLRSTLAGFATPSWPIRWTKLNAKALMRQRRASQAAFYRRRGGRRSKAREDFERDSTD